MNRALFKIHSTLALFAVVPLLLICITGSILVFKHEIDWLLMPEAVRVEPLGERMARDEVLAAVNEAHPDYEAVGWLWFQDPLRADLL